MKHLDDSDAISAAAIFRKTTQIPRISLRPSQATAAALIHFNVDDLSRENQGVVPELVRDGAWRNLTSHRTGRDGRGQKNEEQNTQHRY